MNTNMYRPVPVAPHLSRARSRLRLASLAGTLLLAGCGGDVTVEEAGDDRPEARLGRLASALSLPESPLGAISVVSPDEAAPFTIAKAGAWTAVPGLSTAV